jgi:hypothetical protein
MDRRRLHAARRVWSPRGSRRHAWAVHEPHHRTERKRAGDADKMQVTYRRELNPDICTPVQIFVQADGASLYPTVSSASSVTSEIRSSASAWSTAPHS